MDVIQIEGGHTVTGQVTVEGAKNSALKLMAATIMAPGVTTLTNVPDIADVHVMGKVLKTLGARIEVVDKLREKCNEGFIEIEEESSLFFMKKLVALKLRAELVVFLGLR